MLAHRGERKSCVDRTLLTQINKLCRRISFFVTCNYKIRDSSKPHGGSFSSCHLCVLLFYKSVLHRTTTYKYFFFSLTKSFIFIAPNANKQFIPNEPINFAWCLFLREIRHTALIYYSPSRGKILSHYAEFDWNLRAELDKVSLRRKLIYTFIHEIPVYNFPNTTLYSYKIFAALNKQTQYSSWNIDIWWYIAEWNIKKVTLSLFPSKKHNHSAARHIQKS